MKQLSEMVYDGWELAEHIIDRIGELKKSNYDLLDNTDSTRDEDMLNKGAIREDNTIIQMIQNLKKEAK